MLKAKSIKTCKIKLSSVFQVDPKFTSQRCSACGHTEAGNRPSQELFCCLKCGHTENADVIDAKNILQSAIGEWRFRTQKSPPGEAVKAAQARKGEALNRAEALRGLIAPLVDKGQSQPAIAAALSIAGHCTERGALWSQRTIGRVIERLGLLNKKS